MGKKKPFVSPEHYATQDDVGKRVIVEKKGNGVLRWIGEADWGKGPQTYCGVELDEAIDGNEGNGSVMGVTYFTCDVGKGIFLSIKRVAVDPNQPMPATLFLASVAENDTESGCDTRTEDQGSASHTEADHTAFDQEYANIEPTDEDVQACLEEIQTQFMSELSGEDSKHLKRKQEISAGSASSKKSDWVPQYLKTINDEKAMSKFLDRSTLSHAQLEKLQEAEKHAGTMAKERAINRIKRIKEEEELAARRKREEEEQQRRLVKEREEREARERAEREARALAREQAALQEQERLEREAREKAEREAREEAERLEREARERAERAAREEAEKLENKRKAREEQEQRERDERMRKEQALREAQELAAEKRRKEIEAAENAVRGAQERAAKEAKQAREALAQQLKSDAEEHARVQAQRAAEAQEQQQARDDAFREQLRSEMREAMAAEMSKSVDAMVDARVAKEVAAALQDRRVGGAGGSDGSTTPDATPADSMSALNAQVRALEKKVEDMQATLGSIQSWENQLVRINLKLSDHDTRIANLEQGGSAMNAHGTTAANGESPKPGGISRDNRLTFKKGRKSLVSASANSSDDSDDSDDNGSVSVRARTMSLIDGADNDGSAPSLDNTGRRVTLVRGKKTAEPPSLDNTGSKMILDPSHPDYEGQNVQRAGDLRNIRGVSDASQAIADYESRMSEHEKRLREEEFDAQRKAEARKKFLSKFGKHASTE
eukprot:m.335608 g.335608  ORF g.335608 m.335608 type:complete len:726 (-) comp20526_c0_seq5:3166-5343(-)